MPGNAGRRAVTMPLEKMLGTKLDLSDARTFSAIAKAHDRTESSELRRLVRAYIRGEIEITTGRRPTERTPEAAVTHD
jgi:transposase-like protein